MDVDQNDLQYGGRSPECIGMSLDVKLAFSRVCTLIDSLKDDIGQVTASQQMLRIRNDIAKVLKRKRDREALKENEYPHCNRLDTTASTSRPIHLPVAHNKDSSFNSYLHTSNGHLPFHPNKNEKLYTSFSSSFRPVCNKELKDPHKSVQLGTIIEENRFEVDIGRNSENDSELDEETSTESAYFFLKAWSILRNCNDLLLTGIKMDEKGEVIDEEFVSKKVLCRKSKDTIRTADGEVVLQGSLEDPKNLIPIEVKKQFSEEIIFPKFWKKALQQWIEIDKKKTENIQKSNKKGKSPAAKTVSETAGKEVNKQKTDKRQGKSPAARNKSETARKENNEKSSKQQRKSPAAISKSEAVGKEENRKKSNKGKSPATSSKLEMARKEENKQKSKKEGKSPAARNKPKTAVKDENKQKSKREGKSPAVRNKSKTSGKDSGSDNVENRKLESDDGQEDGPFSDLLGDESLFMLPKSALTPNGLLGSIKKTVIKGRYTPPTNMFDNVYGNKSDNNSSINTSFDDIGVKNNHVVKRMCKVNTKTNSKKNNKNPKRVMEDDEAINEILRAAKAKTNTTPSIMKQVFSAERAEDSVNFSDLSDIDQ